MHAGVRSSADTGSGEQIPARRGVARQRGRGRGRDNRHVLGPGRRARPRGGAIAVEAWLKAVSDVDRLKGGIMGVVSAGRGGVKLG